MNSGPQGVFRALADPTRRQILVHLSKESLAIADIAERFDITRTAINKHLAILEEGGLIRSETSGRERRNSLSPEPLRSAFEWLGYFENFWDAKLTDLQREIAKDMKDRKEKDQ
ncbi:MAG: winged helix-turn-helix transcriptional regulator [Roseibium sp.]|uniref:ArsR/SmtB family transcription factor n=1 Tax=Roseibium sp. TaxID=1936156 RepID=UPI001B105572|nr:metalloregulator ArsR/SmtB family transcription factor [Roseibium sp.]MBO6891321.1 winged helix-turn-helix transcriptional regulator [Roseibium sp.]MBO6933207.1 winged helix-turn-helix transcriptional regulator [Roseibium sp.]